MIIANPIFDIVFKYLLQNIESAQLLIELITQQEIKNIVPINKEFIKANSHQFDFNESYTRDIFDEFRLDFACTTVNEKGEEKNIIIELQRVSLKTDILRFRKYIGFHYLQNHIANKNHDQLDPLEIQGIYFLGEGDKDTKDHLATITRPVTYDFDTQAVVQQKSPFIQKLTHSIIVINIPALNNPKHKNSELYKTLQIFNQKKVVMNTHAEFIEIDETLFPNKFRPLLQRLSVDALDPKISILLEREALLEESRIQEIKTYQESQEQLKQSLLNEKNARIEAQRKQEEAQRKQEAERNTRIEAQRNSIKTLLKYGIKPEEIATELNLPLEEITAL